MIIKVKRNDKLRERFGKYLILKENKKDFYSIDTPELQAFFDYCKKSCIDSVKVIFENGTNEAMYDMVCSPVLCGMTPVKPNSSREGFVKCSKDDPDWYRYVPQVGDDGQSIWANAVAADGSQFVWIPRYAYKIGKITGEGLTLQAPIDIIFINRKNKQFNGNNLPKGYIIHPAFTFGKDELTGFWMAKYAASRSKDNKVQILPEEKIWTGENISTFFDTCYQMASDPKYGFTGLDEGDTHLTKNIEWGAVAYLAHSQYGRNGNKLSINGNLISSKIWNVEQSTTKNISGIYDMASSIWEYVAANNNQWNESAGHSPIFDQVMNQRNSKYIDFYLEDIPKCGDAMEETKGWQNAWFDGLNTSLYPFVLRGGGCSSGSRAGVFAMYASSGNGSDDCGFRPVVCNPSLNSDSDLLSSFSETENKKEVQSRKSLNTKKRDRKCDSFLLFIVIL